MSDNAAGVPAGPVLPVETGDLVSRELESRPHSLRERAQPSPRSLNAKLVVVRNREPSAADDVPTEPPHASGSAEPTAVQDFHGHNGAKRPAWLQSLNIFV